MPIGVKPWYKAISDIVAGSFYPVEIYYATDEDLTINPYKIESFQAIKSFEEWTALEIRPYDQYVTGANRDYKMPVAIISSTYKKMAYHRRTFPTRENIHKRDKYCCIYTGEKLRKEQLSVDHIFPVSRGGKNTWTNLATCEKSLNVWKADRTPEECGLKLLWEPQKPQDGLVFDFLRDEWKIFLHGGEYN
jgi:hypothetical protein